MYNKMFFCVCVGLICFGAVSCAPMPSPVYIGKNDTQVVTPGEIPRDERGEPILSQIPPAPQSQVQPPKELRI
jgi:hypothetical protein